MGFSKTNIRFEYREDEKAQMDQFEKLGFEVIPVEFHDVGAFGGGIHCATADVYR